jgi:hypothetical protein
MLRQSVNLVRGGLMTALALGIVTGMATPAHARMELIQWTHEEASDIAGFRVYARYEGGTFGVVIADIPINQAEVDPENVYSTAIGVDPRENNYVVVTAYDASGGESIYSNEGLFAPPDDDGDGVPNLRDWFPTDPNETWDTDEDTIGDNADFFPNDPTRHSLALSPYRVNVGASQAYLDPDGKTWTRDAGFYAPQHAAAAVSSDEVAGTLLDEMYQSGRTAPSDEGLSFRFPVVPESEYEVRLHFIEPDLPPGDRRFGIAIEGVPIESGFDIRGAAGANDQALVVEYTVTVGDSELDVDLSREATSAGPILMGIEVQSLYADEAEVLTAPGKPFIIESF